MFLRRLIIALALVAGLRPTSVSAQLPALSDASQPIVTQARLVRVYVLLKAAEDAATDAIVTSADAAAQAARAMSYEDLRKACEQSAENTGRAISGAPSKRRPETFANIKNADLRLRKDKEEPNQGHIWYTQQHPERISREIREFIKSIEDALPRIKPE